MASVRRIIVLSGATGFTMLAGWFGMQSMESPETSSPNHRAERQRVVFAVRSMPARRAPLVQVLHLHGRIRAARQVDILAQVPGTVRCVRVSDGHMVRERDTLIEMDDRAYRRSLERARIALLGSQIEYATQVHSPFLGVADSAAAAKLLNEACTQLSLLRDDPHLREGDARDVERRIRHWEAEVAYHSSDRLDVLAHRSGLSEAREAFERAQEDFAQTIIVAPFAGQLTDIRAVPQQYLHQGDVLCTLVDPASLVFEADILESELARIREGQQVDVELLGYPGRILRAVVSAVNPRVAPDGRGIRLQASFARDLTNRAIRVFPGMYAKGTLHTAIVNNGVVIPRDAVLVRNDRNVVFVVREERAEWRYVETGARNDTEIQILRGVHPGERVIVEGHATLVHQAPVMERP